MAQSSFPFEGLDTSETQFGQWASNLQDTGVKGVAGGTNLLVVADNSGMQVRVNAGEAFIRGFYYINTLQTTVAIAPAPVAGQSRIDSVVLTLDIVANSIIAAVVTGTPATTGTQVAPALTQTTTGTYQLLLGNVLVTGGVTSIAASGTVTDLRTFMGSRLGVWTTATRPSTSAGTILTGYNTTLGYYEFWNPTTSVWAALAPLPDLRDTFMLMGA